MSGSLDELVRRMPPPSVAGSVDWPGAERTLGPALPADYKSFVDRYGPGSIAGEVDVYVPGHPDPDLDLLRAGPERLRELGSLLSARQAARWAAPIGDGGLLAWGHEMGGSTFYWATSGPSDRWPLVLDLGGQLAFHPIELQAVQLLLEVVLSTADSEYAFVVDTDPPHDWHPWDASADNEEE